MTTPRVDYIATDLLPLAVEVSTRTEDPENARTHSDENVAAIAASLKQFGQRQPIVVNRLTEH